jgi:hypothetical protein
VVTLTTGGVKINWTFPEEVWQIVLEELWLGDLKRLRLASKCMKDRVGPIKVEKMSNLQHGRYVRGRMRDVIRSREKKLREDGEYNETLRIYMRLASR